MLTHKTLTVTLAKGEITTVDVKALPLSKMEEFLTVQGDAAAVIKLTTGHDADDFHPASALDIADAADELNDPLAARLLKRGQALLARYQVASPSPSPTSSRSSLPPAAPQPGSKPSA